MGQDVSTREARPTDGLEAALVSVVMPSYKNGAYILQAIRSIQEQTYPSWELIVIDDASPDRSAEEVEAEAAKDPRIRLILNKANLGAARARNRGLEAARGRFIAFLDADDLWDPGKLEAQVGRMLDQGWAFSYSGYRMIDSQGKVTGHVEVPPAISYSELLQNTIIGCLTVVLDRTKLDDLSFPDLRTRQDYALWLRLLRGGLVAHGIQEELASYRITPGSISRNKWKAAAQVWRVYRQVERLGLGQASFAFFGYAARALGKHLPILRPLVEWARDLSRRYAD